MKNAITTAIRLLRADMSAERESCKGGANWDWACGSCVRDKRGKCKAQKRYEKRQATIKALRAIE